MHLNPKARGNNDLSVQFRNRTQPLKTQNGKTQTECLPKKTVTLRVNANIINLLSTFIRTLVYFYQQNQQS